MTEDQASPAAGADPALLDEIKLVLRQNVYSVIHFNFGLHGDTADLRMGLGDVIGTLKRHAPKAKLIWATTTPCQKKDDAPDTSVIEKNQAAFAVSAAIGKSTTMFNRYGISK